VARYNELVSAVEELSAQSDVERKAAEERSTAVGEEFSEALGRIELALSQVEVLVEGGLDGALQDLVELDRAMREDLIALTSIKVSLFTGLAVLGPYGTDRRTISRWICISICATSPIFKVKWFLLPHKSRNSKTT
jgi:hypothetical protein